MRKLTDGDLERLDAFLRRLDDDAMLLSELDGYLAGVIVCPDLIPPSEWLPQVWGGDRPVFADQDEASEMIGIVMALYNHIVHALDRPGDYVPRLDADTDGAAIWELWASGFGKALDLKLEAWTHYDDLPEDDPDAMAIRVLDTLAHAADAPGGADLPEELLQSLRADAEGILGACIEDLHHARLAAPRSKPNARSRSVATTHVPADLARNIRSAACKPIMREIYAPLTFECTIR
jgi:uncharacterized protein